MVLIIEEHESSIIVAPTHVDPSKRERQRSEDSKEPLERDFVGRQGLLEKTTAGVMKYKAMPTIFWRLPHHCKLVASLEVIIIVVPSHGGIRGNDPPATTGVIILTDTREETPFRG